MVRMEAMPCSKTMKYVGACSSIRYGCLLFAFHTTCVLMHATWTYIWCMAWRVNCFFHIITLTNFTSSRMCCHTPIRPTLYLASSNYANSLYFKLSICCNPQKAVCEIIPDLYREMIRVVRISLKIAGFPSQNATFWGFGSCDVPWMLMINPY